MAVVFSNDNKYSKTYDTIQWYGEGVRVLTNESLRSATYRWKSRAVFPQFAHYRRNKIPLPRLPYYTEKHVYDFDWGIEKSYSSVTVYRGNGVFEDVEFLYRTIVGSVPVQNHHDFVQGFDLQLAPINDKMNAELLGEATTKLLLKAKDEKFNLAVFSAELNQTVTMVRDFARTMSKVLISLRKGDLKSASQTVGVKISSRARNRYRKRMNLAQTDSEIDQVLASGVLLVQYGIKPLIGDVIGAAEQLAQHHVGAVRSNVRTFKAGQCDHSYSHTSAGSTITGEFESETIVSYSIDFKADASIHLLTKLGLNNPAVVLWEKMPWSFVIDWVIPIGDFLSSIDATTGLQFVDGSRSIKEKMTFLKTNNYSQGTKAVGYTRTEGNSQNKLSIDRFRREVLSSFPSPVFPSFQNPASWTHAVNAVALLVGLKKKIYNPNLVGSD